MRTTRRQSRICLGEFLRSGRPRGPGKVFKKVGSEAPHILEGLPGPPGPARPQRCTPKNQARLPSGTQKARAVPKGLRLRPKTKAPLPDRPRPTRGRTGTDTTQGIPVPIQRKASNPHEGTPVPIQPKLGRPGGASNLSFLFLSVCGRSQKHKVPTNGT